MKKILKKEKSAIIKPEIHNMKKSVKKEKPIIIKSAQNKSKKTEKAIIKTEHRSKKVLKKKEPVIVSPGNPIYLQFKHYESVQSKKALLFSESSLLTILKIMKSYNSLRAEELKLKIELQRALKELDSSVKKTKSVFPFLEIPERLRRKEVIKIEPKKEPPIEEIKPVEVDIDEDLEDELKNIQAKLNSIK